MTHDIKKIAWPAQGIREHSQIEDYTWGFLCFDEQGRVHFDESGEPTREDIVARWSHYLESKEENPIA